MYQFGFERLEVWQEARELVKQIYQLSQNFPTSEKFGLSNQVRRAAISVCSNIAEGCSRKSFKEQYHFSTLAYGSLVEILNQFILSKDLGFITEENLLIIRKSIGSLSVKLNNLRNFQLSKFSN